MPDIDMIYENLDKMMEMKRYKAPTIGYFPTVAEVNTYLRSDKHECMLEYLLWLDECLTDKEDRKKHRDAIEVLRNYMDELMDEEAV